MVAALVALCVACSGSGNGGSHAEQPTTSGTPGAGVTTPNSPGTTPTTKPNSSGPRGRVVFVPGYIDSTGKSDVTDALQHFINTAKDGSVLKFHRLGHYRAEGSLVVGNRHRLTFDGQGAVVFASKRGARDRSQWWVKRGGQIIFRDLKVRGVNPNGGTSKAAYVRKLETQHGFKFEGVQGAELDHVEVSDVYGDFVYITRDKHKVPARNIWIHDSTFRRNGRQGIAVVAANNVIVEHNTFDHTRRSTIDLEPNARSWLVSNVFVLHNSVGKGRLLFVASHGQGAVNNVVISGNQLHGHDLTIDAMAPGKQRRSNWVVTDNKSDTTIHHRPMRFFGIDGLVVKGNTQLVSSKQPGVVMTDDCGTHVSRNEFGSGGVRRVGATCAAALAIPKEPLIFDRGQTPTSTTTAPTTTTSPATPGSTLPGSGPRAPGGGNGLAGWFVLALGVLVLAVAVLMARSRRRKRRGDPPEGGPAQLPP